MANGPHEDAQSRTPQSVAIRPFFATRCATRRMHRAASLCAVNGLQRIIGLGNQLRIELNANRMRRSVCCVDIAAYRM